MNPNLRRFFLAHAQGQQEGMVGLRVLALEQRVPARHVASDLVESLAQQRGTVAASE